MGDDPHYILPHYILDWGALFMFGWDRVQTPKKICARRTSNGRRQLFLEALEDRRMLAVNWRNPVDSLDVGGDGLIVPLDALQVINDLNARGARVLPAVRPPTSPYLDVNGDQNVAPIDVLQIVNALNAGITGPRQLAEGTRLVSEAQVTISLGQNSGSREYRLQIDAAFDTSGTGAAVEDVLAVYLVDPQQPARTILDRGTPGTALFTLAGTQVEVTSSIVRWDGSVLTIDTTSLNSRDTGVLRFQLLNSDSDTGSRVTITPLANEVDPDGAASSVLPDNDSPVAAGSALNLGGLATHGTLTPRIENVRFDSSIGRYTSELRLKNDGPDVGRNVAVAFPGLPAGVTLRNPSGTISDGTPYLNFQPAIRGGGLGRGARSDAVTIEFDDPSQTPFAITAHILAGTNRPPTLDPVGPLTVMPGGVLRVPLVAADPDGDRVTFAIRTTEAASGDLASLPSGTFDANGTLEFRPEPSQLGTYTFEVVASDGALEARQTLTVNVIADPLTTTRISGVVLNLDQTPLAGMKVEVGAVQGLTGADGSFTLDLGSGTPVGDTLKVRGETFPGPLVYPFIAEKLAFMLRHDVFRGVNNIIHRPIFLPPLDMANAVRIDPSQDTKVTTPAIPGMAVFVKAGTLMNQQGTPYNGLLSITEVPAELTPAALPEGLFPDLVVTIQPGEMVFAQPTPLTFPNTAGWAPGATSNLWSIDPVTGEFDDVGDMRVSADGSVIETISGGVRNSSWHCACDDPPPPPPPPPPNNDDDDGDELEWSGPGTSQIMYHTGALVETHELVTYQSLGESRGLTLTYDSMRADPRPIVHTAFLGVDPTALAGPIADQLRLVAELRVQRGNFSVTVPGFVGNQFGLDGGENFWTLPAQAGSVDAALQADLRSLPTGQYEYVLSSGIRIFSQVRQRFVGSARRQTGHLLHVNSIDSPFGSGWGLSGLEHVVENPDGSVMLVNGDGSEMRFSNPVSQIRDFLLPDVNTDSILRYDGLTGELKGPFVASGAGGLDSPHNPTFGPDGNLYVFSNANNGARILRFNGQTGAFIDVFVDTGSGGFTGSAQMAFGPDGNLYLGQGTGVLRFDGVTGAPLGMAASGNGIMRACGIAFGPDGNLYVGDSKPFVSSTNYDRVLRFDTAGNFIDVFVPSGNLNNTCPIDFGSDGHLYIADQTPRDIRRFDGATGTFMGVFASDAQLGTPFRATSGADGNLYVGVFVAGTPGRIARVDGTTGEFINTFVGDNTGFITFFPGADVLPVRRVQDMLIQDAGNDTVLRYDGITGDVIGPFVARGSGGLDQPHNPTFGPDGNLYIFSGAAGSRKILRFDGQLGFFMDVFVDTGEGGFQSGSKIEFGPDGNLYVGSGTQVLRYDSDGEFIDVAASGNGLRNACSVHFGPDGNLYVLDADAIVNGAGDRIVRFNSNTGAFIDTFVAPGQMFNACDMEFGPDGNIYVTDATLGGVRRFDGTDGSFLGVFANTSSTAVSGLVFGPDGNLYVNVNGNMDRFNGQTGQFIERFVAGNAGFVNFFPAAAPLGASVFQSPRGDFSKLEKLVDGTFRRTMTDQTVHEFDAVGRLVKMTDRNHNATTWEYNTAGNLARVVDPVGLATTLAYTGGRVTSITDPAGRVTRFEYDTAGNLTRITDPDGSRRTFDYDTDHHMTGETDQRGNHEEAIYDFAGRVDQVIRKNGAVIDLSPTQVRGLYPTDQTDDPFTAPLAVGDLTGQATYVDGNGNLIVTTLDSMGQKTASTDAIGAMPIADFDPATNEIRRVTDARGNVTNYTYDAQGNLTSSFDSLNPTNPAQLTYDSVFNQLSGIRDALGRQIRLDIDPDNGNTRSLTREVGAAGPADDLVTQMTYASRGLLDTITDPLGRQADFQYDTLGRLIQVTFAIGSADEAVMQMEYDASGNTTAMIDENGNRTQFQYDALNRLTQVTEPDPDGAGPLAAPVTRRAYDAAGNLISTIDALGNVTQFEYDELNRQSRLIDALGRITSFSYDNADHLRTASDPLAHTTELAYDARNRPIESIDPANGSTRYQYDLDDNLIAIIDPSNNKTRFEYDARNRLTRKTDPLGNVTLYTYDLADNLIAMTDRNGRVTQYAYDELDRRITETWVSGSNVVRYDYDKAGNLLSVVDAFSSLDFSYDNRDRVATVDNDGTPNVPRVVLDYDYDDAGNLVSVADTIGGAAAGLNSYQYDALNRLVRLTQSGANVSPKRVDFAYNPLDQFTSIARFADLAGTQSVVNSTYSYDVLNRLTQLNHANSGGPVAFFNFAFDPAGRITQITDINGTTDYVYDSRDELVSAAHSDPTNADERYVYDANGNRVSATTIGAPTVYQTGPNNRLLSDGTFTYEYDKEGNLSRRVETATGATRDYTWDFRNRLAAVIDRDSLGAETQRVEFTYDAFNRRISKNVVNLADTVLTHFVYDRSNVLLDFVDPDGTAGANPPGLAQRYLHGPAVDQVLAQDDGAGNVLWMLTDHLGTVTDLVNSAGDVVNHIRYDSYGNVISESNPAVKTRYRFTGREFDAETDLHFYRARYYAAETGRFVSEDPLGFDAGDANLCRYVENSPVNHRDPSGHGLCIANPAFEPLRQRQQALHDRQNALLDEVFALDYQISDLEEQREKMKPCKERDEMDQLIRALRAERRCRSRLAASATAMRDSNDAGRLIVWNRGAERM